MEEKIIKRIEKLLALAGNNPNEKEAEAALLKAQKLMAEYGIEQSQLTGEKITYKTAYSSIEAHRMNNALAKVIADSFACKVILCYKSYASSKRVVCFFGRTEFAEAAKSAFEFCIHVMRAGGTRAIRNAGEVPGAKGSTLYRNSYCLGFISGLKSKTSEQCKALAIIVPQDVEDNFKSAYPKTGVQKNKAVQDMDRNSYMNGVTDGQSALGKRELHA